MTIEKRFQVKEVNSNAGANAGGWASSWRKRTRKFGNIYISKLEY
jgi:hypothetical protein